MELRKHVQTTVLVSVELRHKGHSGGLEIGDWRRGALQEACSA